MRKLKNIKLKKIFQSRKLIWEGLINNLIRRPEIEAIAYERMNICAGCDLFDQTGEGCMLPGTQPCCNQNKGGCGCKLEFATRSLSKSCPHPQGPKWEARMTEKEQDEYYTKIKYNPDAE